MLLLLINFLIIILIGAFGFFLLDRFAGRGRLQILLKILVVLLCLVAILERLLPALGVGL